MRELSGRKNRRTTTKEDSLSKAKEVAEDWYLQLRGKLRDGELKSGKTVPRSREVVPARIRHHHAGTTQSNLCARTARATNGHLVPFFGQHGASRDHGWARSTNIASIDSKSARLMRGKPPAHNTMHQEIVTLRQIFKTALRHGWIDHLPDLSEPYRSSAKISHRAWFSPEEYKQLYEATRKRAHDPKQPRFRWEAEQLHDYVLFSANTGSVQTRQCVFSSAMSR